MGVSRQPAKQEAEREPLQSGFVPRGDRGTDNDLFSLAVADRTQGMA